MLNFNEELLYIKNDINDIFITRYKPEKDIVVHLNKALHYINLLIEYYETNNNETDKTKRINNILLEELNNRFDTIFELIVPNEKIWEHMMMSVRIKLYKNRVCGLLNHTYVFKEITEIKKPLYELDFEKIRMEEFSKPITPEKIYKIDSHQPIGPNCQKEYN